MESDKPIYIYTVIISILAVISLILFILFIFCKTSTYSPYKPTPNRYKARNYGRNRYESFTGGCTVGSYNSHMEKIKDKCLCSGFGDKMCKNKDESQASYSAGKTEYQDVTKNEKKGIPFYKNTNFNMY